MASKKKGAFKMLICMDLFIYERIIGLWQTVTLMLILTIIFNKKFIFNMADCMF